MHRAVLVFALLASIVTPGRNGLHAQSTLPVTLGERVRLSMQSPTGTVRTIGRVIAVQGDSLTLAPTDAEPARSFARSDIQKLEVSFGIHRQTRKGMVIGGILGFGAGAAIAAATYRKPDCVPDLFGCYLVRKARGINSASGALVGGIVGIPIGALIGHARSRERWLDRSLGTGTRVGLAPGPRLGSTLILRMRF
jgi:hypothetical protein